MARSEGGAAALHTAITRKCTFLQSRPPGRSRAFRVEGDPTGRVMMTAIHLTASPFYGGPERQMLGLARALAGRVRTVFLSFSEGGNCRPFIERARLEGFEAHELEHDTPRFRQAASEIAGHLRHDSAPVLCVHGYKAGLLGRLAARRARVPVVAVSRGWTYQSPRVRFYEFLDRVNLRWMDRVVCVSESQATKVRRVGVPIEKMRTIPNAIELARFARHDPTAREELHQQFSIPVTRIVGAAGRLSPEKGFDVLVDAAAQVSRRDDRIGFILFGNGVLREVIEKRVSDLGLNGRFVLAGFCSELDRFLPHLDLLVQSSYTEGMPNVILEASGAGVPVVATAVGGTTEIVDDGLSGCLVPAGDPSAMADRIIDVLSNDEHRRTMGMHGLMKVRAGFTFEAQAAAYTRLFDELNGGNFDSANCAQVVSRCHANSPIPSASEPAK